MKALEWFDGWIFGTYERCAPALPFYRIIVGLYLLIFHFPRYSWIGDLPSSFFVPPLGLPMLFPGFPPKWA